MDFPPVRELALYTERDNMPRLSMSQRLDPVVGAA
jgi:hypothetical protein